MWGCSLSQWGGEGDRGRMGGGVGDRIRGVGTEEGMGIGMEMGV